MAVQVVDLGGIGQRPDDERPDLEPLIVRLYEAMYEAIAVHSRRGINVVVDAVHHDEYSQPLDVTRRCAEQLRNLPVIFVGVRCPVEVALARRRATWGGEGFVPSSAEADPVARWHRAVHTPGRYDLEVDTSVQSPVVCARLIRKRLGTQVFSSFFDQPGPTPTTSPS